MVPVTIRSGDRSHVLKVLEAEAGGTVEVVPKSSFALRQHFNQSPIIWKADTLQLLCWLTALNFISKIECFLITWTCISVKRADFEHFWVSGVRCCGVPLRLCPSPPASCFDHQPPPNNHQAISFRNHGFGICCPSVLASPLSLH